MDLPDRLVLHIWRSQEGVETKWTNPCSSATGSDTILLGVLCKRPSIRSSNGGLLVSLPLRELVWLLVCKERQQHDLTLGVVTCIWTRILTEQGEVGFFLPPCSHQFRQNPSNQSINSVLKLQSSWSWVIRETGKSSNPLNSCFLCSIPDFLLHYWTFYSHLLWKSIWRSLIPKSGRGKKRCPSLDSQRPLN